ncbi:Uncharacterised protein [Streptococcus pneumoniae]|nr:Uncharacterised protein [Streptococcus pneumoniae]
MSPIPPCDEGAFTIRRQAFIRNPNCFCTSLFTEWITAECPKPPRFNISSQYVNPSSNEFAFTQANTGLNFSRDSGYAAPMPCISATSIFVFLGTVIPTNSAIYCAGFPTISLFTAHVFSLITSFSNLLPSSSVTK